MARGGIDKRQGQLFDKAATARDFEVYNIDGDWRRWLSEAIAASGKSREAIAAEMEQLLGSNPDYPVSKAMLDAWTAPSRTDWRFPLIYIRAFVTATGADWLLDRVARWCGRLMITGEQAAHAELGMVMAEQQALKERERALRAQLKARA
jgi:hypothetical protein